MKVLAQIGQLAEKLVTEALLAMRPYVTRADTAFACIPPTIEREHLRTLDINPDRMGTPFQYARTSNPNGPVWHDRNLPAYTVPLIRKLRADHAPFA